MCTMGLGWPWGFVLALVLFWWLVVCPSSVPQPWDTSHSPWETAEARAKGSDGSHLSSLGKTLPGNEWDKRALSPGSSLETVRPLPLSPNRALQVSPLSALHILSVTQGPTEDLGIAAPGGHGQSLQHMPSCPLYP